MSEPRTSRPSLAVFGALILASVTSTALVAARVVHTRRLAFLFLVYNLVLAWIPLALSVVLHALELTAYLVVQSLTYHPSRNG